MSKPSISSAKDLLCTPTRVAVVGENNIIVTASEDRFIRIWDHKLQLKLKIPLTVRPEGLVMYPILHSFPTTAERVSPASTPSGSVPMILPPSQADPTIICLARTSHQFSVTGEYFGGFQEPPPPKGSPSYLSCSSPVCTGSFYAYIHSGKLRVFNIVTRELCRTWKVTEPTALAALDNLILVGDRKGRITLIDVSTNFIHCFGVVHPNEVVVKIGLFKLKNSSTLQVTSVGSASSYCTMKFNPKPAQQQNSSTSQPAPVPTQTNTNQQQQQQQQQQQKPQAQAQPQQQQQRPKKPSQQPQKEPQAKNSIPTNTNTLIDTSTNPNPSPSPSPNPNTNTNTNTDTTSTTSSSTPATEQYKCATCGTHTKEKCGGCNSVYYCNRNCQKAHWPQHKQACRANRK